jgi:hypothetical protein
MSRRELGIFANKPSNNDLADFGNILFKSFIVQKAIATP